MSCVKLSSPGCASATNCPDCFGCVAGVCPDFQIKKGETKPAFRVSIEDETGPMNMTGLIVEANMWANAKLKKDITALDTSLAFADNIGFCQILVNDLIFMNRTRSVEQMRITGFDEVNNLVLVERGANGTVPQIWKRGTDIKIFRILNGAALSEMVFDDEVQVDGTVNCNVLADSFLVYEWNVNDTCSAGCFSFEFKILKMADSAVVPSVIPACFLGTGVEWTRKFPTCKEFLVKVCDSPNTEIVFIPSTT